MLRAACGKLAGVHELYSVYTLQAATPKQAPAGCGEPGEATCGKLVECSLTWATSEVCADSAGNLIASKR